MNMNIEKSEWLESQGFVATHAKEYSWTTSINSSPQFQPYWIASFKDEEEKRKVIRGLNQAGIQSRSWWARPLSSQKAFSESKFISLNGNAKFLSDVHLGLPMYRDLPSDNVLDICDVIQTSLEK
jgi:dTDP-4-amino-4,6-dideoxygalactose transaminase